MAHSLTIQQAEAQVRFFAMTYPTPNTERAVKLAEEGVVSWFQLYDLFRSSLAKAVQEVSA